MCLSRFVVFLGLLSSAAFAQVLPASGTLVKEIFSRGKVLYSAKADFQVAAYKDGYAMKLIEPEEYQNWKTLVVSDWKSTYSSIIIDYKGRADSSGDGIGNFETGALPNRFDDRLAAQALALSLLVVLKKAECIEVDGLKDQAVPAYIAHKIAKEAAVLKTQVLFYGSGGVKSIDFWALQPGVKQSTLKNTNGCFLLARLSLAEAPDGFPGNIELTVFRRGPAEAGSDSLRAVRYTIMGKPSEDFVGGALPVAYDPGVGISVNDYRGGERTSLFLEAGSPVPFK